jgi:glycosyltransferase involved in cell wall biosynthesis
MGKTKETNNYTNSVKLLKKRIEFLEEENRKILNSKKYKLGLATYKLYKLTGAHKILKDSSINTAVDLDTAEVKQTEKTQSDKTCNFLKTNWKHPLEKTVFIFQYSFYDPEGKDCYNGGAERYVRDLAVIIRNMGFEILVIQKSGYKQWFNSQDNFSVLGTPFFESASSLLLLNNLVPKHAIYSGLSTNYGKKIFDNSTLISHGIEFDGHGPAPIERIEEILSTHSNIVSVDTNTISVLRTINRTLSDEHISFRYIPNYVDLNQFYPEKSKKTSDEIKICFPRRLSNERGYWLVSEIIDEVMALSPKITLDFIGYVHTEEIKTDLDEIKKKYKNRINNFSVSPDEMPKLYKQYDISLVPTLFAEGTSLSTLEAMASGSLVISTNIGGLPNLIFDRYNGLLINPSSKELYDAIKEVVNNDKLLKNCINNGLKVAQSFSKTNWDKKWKKYLDTVLFN